MNQNKLNHVLKNLEITRDRNCALYKYNDVLFGIPNNFSFDSTIATKFIALKLSTKNS